MSTIPLGLGDFESSTQNIQRLKLHNMYVVPNPVAIDEVSRVSRPTLTPAYQVGSGPIYSMWRQPNLLNGDSLVVSGVDLYRLTASGVVTWVGPLPGKSPADIAGTVLEGSSETILLVRDGILYKTDGTSITIILTPDNQRVASVATMNQYFIFSIENTQKFYWLEPGSTVIDPLDFASAERIPDPIISVKVVADELWFIGLSGPEVWAATGDVNAPFQRISGRVYNEGCHNRDTVVAGTIQGLPSLIWVTDTKAVVRAQGSPAKISNESVEEILKTADSLTAWLFRYNRHDFYVLSSPLFTLVYDLATSIWSRWDTYNLPFWIAQSGVQIKSTVYAGDSTSNRVYKLLEGVDDNGLPVVREVSGFVAGNARPVTVGEVVVYVNAGWSNSYVIEPILELRWSDNLGATWSNYVQATLGVKGAYDQAVVYRSLGLLRSAGRIFEFRIADFVRFRIDGCTLNARTEASK